MVFWIVPPVQPVWLAFVHGLAVAVPLTVSALLAPVSLSTMPPLAPFEVMLWKASGAAPTSSRLTSSALPLVGVDGVRRCRVTFERVPRRRRRCPGAWRPLPVVVSMFRPPPVNVSVWLLLPVKVTAEDVPVFSVFAAEPLLLKTVEPPLLVETTMPPPVSLPSLIGPLIVTDAAAAVEDRDAPAAAVADGAREGHGARAAVEAERRARGAAVSAMVLPLAAENVPAAEVGERDAVRRAGGRADGVEVQAADGRAGDARSAGPPVAEMFAVPPPGTLTVPAELMSSAGVVPDVVVRLRSVPEPLPSCVVPEMLNSRTPPLPEPVTVMSSNTLPAPMFVVSASSAAAPLVVTEIVPADRKFTVPAPLRTMPFAVAAASSRRCCRRSRSEMFAAGAAGRPAELQQRLGAGGAGVDDPDVVDARPLTSPESAGDAAARALRVDGDAADLVAGRELDDVLGGGRGERRVGVRVRRVQGLGAERAAAVRIHGQALVLADQPLAGRHRVAGVEARRRVVAVEDEDGVVGGGLGLGLRERVERLGGGAASPALAGSLSTYQTQPAIVDRDGARSPVPAVGVSPSVTV